jgi:hypothetical protein
MRSILSVSAAALLATCLTVGAHAAPALKSDGKIVVAQMSEGKDAMAKSDKSSKKSKKSKKMKSVGAPAPAVNKGLNTDGTGGNSGGTGGGGSGGAGK